MDIKKFILKFLRNTLIATLLAVVALGAFGYFLAGKEGLINMAGWGLLFGLLGGLFGGVGEIMYTYYWRDYAGRYGKHWLNKETEGEEKDSGWPR